MVINKRKKSVKKTIFLTKKRNTFQKMKILDYVKHVKTHPSAEEVFNAVKKEIPNITLATVYRNLNSLYEDGLINRLSINNEFHYDANIDGHLHFFCLSCGKIEDIFVNADVLNKFLSNREIKKKTGSVFAIDFFLKGVCRECYLKSKNVSKKSGILVKLNDVEKKK